MNTLHLRSHCTLMLAALALAASLAPAQSPASKAQTAPASAPVVQPFTPLQQAIFNTPSPESLRAWHDLLGSEPHVAGTPGDARNIERIAAALKDMGLEVQVHEFWPYLPMPVRADLQVIVTDSAKDAPGKPTIIPLLIAEVPLAEDPASSHPDLQYGWNAYSGNGDVTAEVVYANRGTKEDFATLKRLGIDVAGKVVIARYGGNFRGYKAKFAEEAGAAALLIFTDPADAGFGKGLPYPDGGWANHSCIQRGSLITLPYPGDPLTPGTPATRDAKRLDPDDVALPKIPVQPIGYGAAGEIITRMQGTPLPQDDAQLIKSWQGGLPCAYRLTGGPNLKVRVAVEQKREIVKTANVVAFLRGAVHPDQRVIIGCHHDAWGAGASDPLCGTILVMEAAKAFAEAASRGHRPARTIQFALWGAEEFGIIGSTEYCEQYAEDLQRESIAYINLDAATMGTEFSSAASPSLHQVITDVSKSVPQARGPAGQMVYDAWRGEKPRVEFGDMGGGSDHVGFYCHLGIPSCALNAGGAPGSAYHSNYDTLTWYRKVVGEDYQPALMLSRMTNLLASRLADDALIPLDPCGYASDCAPRLEDAAKRAAAAGLELDVSPLLEAARRLAECGEQFARLRDPQVHGKLDAATLAAFNQALIRMERCWLLAEGLPERPWFRSLYGSSDPDSGYAAWTLPGLRWVVERRAIDQADAVMSRYATAFSELAGCLTKAAESAKASSPRLP